MLIQIFSVLGGTGLIGSVIVIIINRWLKRRDEVQAAAEADRRAESQVTLTMLLTVGDLSRTSGIALRDVVHVNGEMGAAIDAYDKARKGVTDYLIRKNAG